MANSTPVPSLGTQGWVSDPSTKMDLLLSHFFLSDYNQTELYPGTVLSLTRIMQQTGGELNSVISEIRQGLTNYLNQYYDRVNVEIKTVTDIRTDPRSKLDLELTIQVIENTSSLGYTRLLKTVDSKMETIVKLNNFN